MAGRGFTVNLMYYSPLPESSESRIELGPSNQVKVRRPSYCPGLGQPTVMSHLLSEPVTIVETSRGEVSMRCRMFENGYRLEVWSSFSGKVHFGRGVFPVF